MFFLKTLFHLHLMLLFHPVRRGWLERLFKTFVINSPRRNLNAPTLSGGHSHAPSLATCERGSTTVGRRKHQGTRCTSETHCCQACLCARGDPPSGYLGDACSSEASIQE